jgi:hypothetical protein
MDEVVLSDCALLEHLKVDLEDKDSITAFLRREVSFRALDRSSGRSLIC